MAALDAAIQEKKRILQAVLNGRVKPGHDSGNRIKMRLALAGDKRAPAVHIYTRAVARLGMLCERKFLRR
jgi:hypothetical protein